MSETARALGQPGAITWKRQTLKVSRVIFDIEGYFELYLENQLSAALERARAVNSLAAYKDRIREANAQLASGDFAWEGEVAQRAAWSARGFKELAFFCVSELQPGWTRTQHDELFRESAAAAARLREVPEDERDDPTPETLARLGLDRDGYAALRDTAGKVQELIRLVHRIGDPHPNGPGPAPAAGPGSPEPSGSPSSAPSAG